MHVLNLLNNVLQPDKYSDLTSSSRMFSDLASGRPGSTEPPVSMTTPSLKQCWTPCSQQVTAAALGCIPRTAQHLTHIFELFLFGTRALSLLQLKPYGGYCKNRVVSGPNCLCLLSLQSTIELICSYRILFCRSVPRTDYAI